MEEVLLPVMFDLPSREDVASVVITEDVVLRGAEPTVIQHVTKRRKSA
jgi:ATP-dependent Clp protease ATP-binding subunit ClpX